MKLRADTHHIGSDYCGVTIHSFQPSWQGDTDGQKIPDSKLRTFDFVQKDTSHAAKLHEVGLEKKLMHVEMGKEI